MNAAAPDSSPAPASTRKMLMKDVLKAIALAGAIVAVVVGITFLSLGVNRVAAPYTKETERLTYQNSVARQQGADNGIAEDCANMQANTGAQRLAFARFVVTDAAAYSGDRGLSADAEACVAQARSALAAAPTN